MLKILLVSILIISFVKEIKAEYKLQKASFRFTSGYGVRTHPILKIKKHHNGYDFSAPLNTPIALISSGKVIFAGNYKGYGKLITILTANNKIHMYAHCNKILVKLGDRVKKGQVIGLVGSTGLSTAPHLHFEERGKF